ncbi:MAG: hypothetical protein ABSF23_09285 [Terracidiphilus sp.]
MSFSTLLSEIGSALTSGNISTAQSTLVKFLATLSTGTFVNTMA